VVGDITNIISGYSLEEAAAFLVARGRVAPLNILTEPQFELLGALTTTTWLTFRTFPIHLYQQSNSNALDMGK